MMRAMRRGWVVWTSCGLVAALAATLILFKAYRARSGDDFWPIAVPGVLTGVGTLALAAVTVVLAYQERRRGDKARTADRRRDDDLRTDERRRDDQLRAEERKRNDQLLALGRAEARAAAHRAQADLISAWYAGRWTTEVNGDFVEDGPSLARRSRVLLQMRVGGCSPAVARLIHG